MYEFPGRFSDSATGESAMRNRMQAVETDHNEGSGASAVRTLGVARRFTPYEEAYSDSKYEPHIATRVEHHVRDATYEAGSTGVRNDPAGKGKNDPKQPKPADPGPSYENKFAAQPAAQPATPNRDTHRPRIDGARFAVVAGPAGEEVYTDSYGRRKRSPYSGSRRPHAPTATRRRNACRSATPATCTGLDAVEQLMGDTGWCFGPEPGLAHIYLAPQLFSANRFKVPLHGLHRIGRVASLVTGHAAFAAAAPARQLDAE